MPQATDSLDALLAGLELPGGGVDFVADSVDYEVLPRDFDQAATVFVPLLDTARIQQLTVVEAADTAVVAEAVVEPPRWQEGIEPIPRNMLPGTHSTFLLVLAALFVMMAFNYHHLKRLLKQYVDDLIKVRRGRDNVFDERTAGDTRIQVYLLVQCVVGCGILLAGGVCGWLSGTVASLTGQSVGRIIALVAIYYLFDLVAYQTVGYTFSTPEGRREWVRGFNASQTLLGVAVAFPALLAVFYPSLAPYMVMAGIVCFAMAKILFIIKGFRIFYDKISSLLYFILYLCTLEIIPLAVVYQCSVMELI